MIGYAEMPEDFEYKDVFLKGPPVHEPGDSFLLKHPPMELSRRAKIFKPFAALDGFEEAIAAAEELHESLYD